jgi:hypothetical protein
MVPGGGFCRVFRAHGFTFVGKDVSPD